MASKRRIRRNSCTGKKRYETSQQARSAAHHKSLELHHDIHAYRCHFCSGYHIGHHNLSSGAKVRRAIAGLIEQRKFYRAR
ncbi:MAG: hypothetical protein KGZ30_04405 [Anaplasmataceae bacterium]|nr:hypothetical protein [Anaplasmataceae bacterium]